MNKKSSALSIPVSNNADQNAVDTVVGVLEIGRSGVCNKENLVTFLPSFPTLHGSEAFLKIDRLASKMHLSTPEMIYLIKGSHLIDKKYGELTDNISFGIGSPCKTHVLIKTLQKHDDAAAEKCYKWVAENHGNYYIEPNTDPYEFAD